MARRRRMRTMFTSWLGLTVFIFSLSCTLAMSAEEVEEALVSNVSSVVIISHYTKSILVRHLVVTISLFVLITSFIGVLIGMREAVNGLFVMGMRKFFPSKRVH